MIKSIWTLIFLSIISISYGQRGGREIPVTNISGKILEKDTDTPIEYASISLTRLNRSGEKTDMVDGGITNDKGVFFLENVKVGRYEMEVSFIGYAPIIKNIGVRPGEVLKLGTLYLEQDSEVLSALEIRAEKTTIENKIDKRVVNIGQDLTAAGASATDVLANIPSINVDEDGNISLRGNDNVRVLVDGRPSAVPASQLLASLGAEAIEKVEVITTPSAKYNPEGLSGILNIILKKNRRKGINGSVGLGYSNNGNDSYNGSLDFNYFMGKANFYVNYGHRDNVRERVGNRYVYNSISGIEVNQAESRLDNRASDNVKLGMDYYINDKHTLYVYTNQRKRSRNGTESYIIDSIAASTDINQNFVSSSAVQSFSDSDGYNHDYNIGWKNEIDKEGQELEINYQIAFSERDELSTNTIFQNSPSESTTHQLNIDYVKPIGDNKLEFGMAYNGDNILNSMVNSNFSGVELASFDSDFDRKITAVYANWQQKKGKIGYQIGLRAENAVTTNSSFGEETYKDDRISLYPSAFLTYEKNDDTTWQLNLSRRVDRPRSRQINPFNDANNPAITYLGNPEIDPQFTYSSELAYLKKTKIGTISATAYYRRTVDYMSRVLSLEPETGRILLQFDNVAEGNAYGFELSGNLNLAKWWRMNYSTDLYQFSLTGDVNNDGTNETSELFNWNFRVMNNFKINKKLSMQLTGFYRGRGQMLQGSREPMGSLDFGARYNFKGRKASLGINFRDILSTMEIGWNTQIDEVTNIGNVNFGMRSVNVSFNYIFGNNKLKRKGAKKQGRGRGQGMEEGGEGY